MKIVALILLTILVGCGLSPQDMRAKIDKCKANGFGYNLITSMGVKGGLPTRVNCIILESK